jgi:hypothetical protein
MIEKTKNLISTTEKFRRDYLSDVKDLLDLPKECSDHHDTLSSSGDNSDRDDPMIGSPHLSSSYAFSSNRL